MSIRKTLISCGILFSTLANFSCNPNDFAQGKVLYEFHCSNCHMNDGTGLKNLIPPLKDSDYFKKQADKLPCIIKYGIKDTIKVNGIRYTEPMVGFENLSTAEISNICNYLYNEWNNNIKTKDIVEINDILSKCE